MRLDARQRRQLHSLAHALKPAVRVAPPKTKGGPVVLTAAVLAEISDRLDTDELIMVELGKVARAQVEPALDTIPE